MKDIKENQGIPLDLSLIKQLRVNTSAVEKRCKELPGRRSVKKEWQVAWLLKAVTLIDLTTLNGDDSSQRVKRLVNKALCPVSPSILEDLDYPVKEEPLLVGAVCVYHQMIKTASEVMGSEMVGSKTVKMANGNSGQLPQLPIAAVSTGFPAGLNSTKAKELEVVESIKAGATEIDMVITRHLVFEQKWKDLYREVAAFKKICREGVKGRPAHLKVILATGDLTTLSNVAMASWVVMMAGADFIKTSTGKESVNATLPVSLVMLRAIRDYHLLTGYEVGFKPAGGISTSKDALTHLALVKEELGNRWNQPALFRFGASSLLGDIERQLFHNAYGEYAARRYHPIN